MKQEDTFDIVVIGAGIQGAGVAQAAAACGFKTLVIEKFPHAGMGTSCKSSKLIHGGLRYLESGQFKLVHECLAERKTLLNNAPDLVKLIPFHIPVYKKNRRPAWLIGLGLSIYSVFSFKPFSILNRKHWQTLDGLNQTNLKAVFRYYDAQTDDRLLTQSVISSAQAHGAKIKYCAHFKQSHYQDGLHRLSYIQDSITHSVASRFIINCSGPWLKQVQSKISPTLKLPDIELVAGTHITVNKTLEKGGYYIEANDGRAVFFLPWKDSTTLIGTTEKSHSGTADNVTPSEEEILYLLSNYNQHFAQNIKRSDIVDTFSGLRVLPGNNDSAFKKSRDSLIIKSHDTPGLITIVGGKLTAYRASSEEIIGLVKKTLKPGSTKKQCDTRKILLPSPPHI